MKMVNVVLQKLMLFICIRVFSRLHLKVQLLQPRLVFITLLHLIISNTLNAEFMGRWGSSRSNLCSQSLLLQEIAIQWSCFSNSFPYCVDNLRAPLLQTLQKYVENTYFYVFL